LQQLDTDKRRQIACSSGVPLVGAAGWTIYRLDSNDYGFLEPQEIWKLPPSPNGTVLRPFRISLANAPASKCEKWIIRMIFPKPRDAAAGGVSGRSYVQPLTPLRCGARLDALEHFTPRQGAGSHLRHKVDLFRLGLHFL